MCLACHSDGHRGLVEFSTVVPKSHFDDVLFHDSIILIIIIKIIIIIIITIIIIMNQQKGAGKNRILHRLKI